MYAFVVDIPRSSGGSGLDFGCRDLRLGSYLLYQQLKARSLNMVHLGKLVFWFGPHQISSF